MLIVGCLDGVCCFVSGFVGWVLLMQVTKRLGMCKWIFTDTISDGK